jgi:LacI family transcriptional regulator
MRILMAVEVFTGYQRQLVRGAIDFVRHAAVNWQFAFDHRPPGARGGDVLKLRAFGNVHGVLFHGNENDARVRKALREHQKAGAEVIVVGHHSDHFPSVYPDEAKVSRLAFDHLRERGFQNLGYYGAAPWQHPVFQQRWHHFREAALADHLREPRLAPADAVEQSIAGRKKLARWIAKLPTPTGLFCGNLDYARRAVMAAHEVGRDVPTELGVLGVDTDDVFCEMVSPSLSTIDHGMRAVGFEAAQMLHDRILHRGHVMPAQTVPPVGVEQRQSTNTLAVDDAEVRKLIELIQQLHTDPALTVASLIDNIPSSRRSLETRFRRSTNRGIHEQLVRTRVETAKALLLSRSRRGAAKLEAVSRLSGFSSPARLSEAFVRFEGSRPGVWRSISLGSRPVPRPVTSPRNKKTKPRRTLAGRAENGS